MFLFLNNLVPTQKLVSVSEIMEKMWQIHIVKHYSAVRRISYWHYTLGINLKEKGKNKNKQKTPKQKPLNCEISTQTIHIIILHLPNILQKAKQPTEITH